MEQDYVPPGAPLAAPSNDESSSVATEKADAALKKIARLIGRQIARETFEAGQRANDDDPSSENRDQAIDPMVGP